VLSGTGYQAELERLLPARHRLINYFKYPVILDGKLFRETFGWKPKRNLNDIFSYYRKQKLAAKAAR